VEIHEELANTVAAGDALLFAGAGCSALLGLPVWGKYLESLAATAERFEAETAALMRRRIAAGEFLKAATLFKRILQAPTGEVYSALSQPFKPGTYDFKPLLPLSSMPFSGIVTTNYDSSLFEAQMCICSRDKKMLPQHLTTRDTKGAAYCDAPFVLFLHGRGSIPLQAEQMVFDEQDYRECYDEPSFTDGLLQLLSSRTCVFLGFSFKDPGIDSVLRLWTVRRGPAFPRTHLAILPRSAVSLTSQLAAMGVRILLYGDDHAELWGAVSKAASMMAATSVPAGGYRLRRTPLTAARDMLAMCYARSSLGGPIEPLRNVVMDGAALALITQNSTVGIGVAALKVAMAQRLGMLPVEIDAQMEASLQRLVRLQACRIQDQTISATGIVGDEIGPQSRLLAEAVVRRAELREGVKLAAAAVAPIAQTLEDLMIARAWDLAAHFIQPRSGSVHGVDESIEEVLRVVEYPDGIDRNVVKRAIMDLLVKPSSAEAEKLAVLGRLAFAVQLALGNARSTLAYKTTLPQKLYLDASILMPAILDGHPLQAVYAPVLQRLREQAAEVGGEAVSIAPMEFLNEVISHRTNAIREVKSRGLEDATRLERDVMLYGAENLNVFVGAYATHVGRLKRKLSFDDFLKRYAPYSTEEALATFLAEKGVRAEWLESLSLTQDMWAFYNPLKDAYEREEDLFGARKKEAVLIKHEAWQLARLADDQRNGLRSVFVTADSRLRRAVASLEDCELGDSLLSGVNLVKLIDLLLGVKIDHQGLARLIWGIHAMDAGETIRRYFTDRGLQRRGDVETMVLPEVVEIIRTEATGAPEFADINVFADDAMERAKMAAFLDRFEDRFYEMLRDAVERRRRQFEEQDKVKEPLRASKAGRNDHRKPKPKSKRQTKRMR